MKIITNFVVCTSSHSNDRVIIIEMSKSVLRGISRFGLSDSLLYLSKKPPDSVFLSFSDQSEPFATLIGFDSDLPWPINQAWFVDEESETVVQRHPVQCM